MKRTSSVFAVIVFVSSMLLGCASAGQGDPPEPGPDFGFRFEDLSRYNDVLDTFDETFTTLVDYDPPQSVTISLGLSDQQMRAVYGKMIEIDFFSYPEIFAIPTPSSGVTVWQTPAAHYHIMVKNRGMEKTLDWVDEIRGLKSHKADQLRSLFQMIEEMVSASPEYRQLPERWFGCA